MEAFLMSTENITLKQLLIQDLNPGFVNVLLQRMQSLYPEAHSAMFNDPNLGEEQANYVLGHYRRGCAESILMRTAAEFGLHPKIVQPEGGGCKHVYVSVGRFGLVMCHVTGPDAFPQHSANREQSAQVNEFISQMSLLAEATAPEPEEFYGIIVHTEVQGKKDTFGSLKLGFPNPEFEGWQDEPVCLQDIHDIQQSLFQPQDDLQAQIQNPKPLWKTEKNDNAVNEE